MHYNVCIRCFNYVMRKVKHILASTYLVCEAYFKFKIMNRLMTFDKVCYEGYDIAGHILIF